MRVGELCVGATDYAGRHWRGEQPIAISFWVNFVLPRVAIICLEWLFLARLVDGVIATAAYILVADVALLVWQIVGVVRSLEKSQSRIVSLPLVWGVHSSLVVCLFFTAVSVFLLLQSAFVEPAEEPLSAQWERERAAKYALELSRDGDAVYLTGTFEHGITKALKALLRQNPKVAGIVLESPGGNTYEGRGVAQTVRNQGLQTYVFAECFSACTLAFIAGVTRTLGPEAKLGFHQYGLDADYQVPFLDIEDEQETDRAFFEAQGIDKAFLDKIFEASQSDLWIPRKEELLDAGVVHRIEDRRP